jgi:phosphatidylinositol 3-kinase
MESEEATELLELWTNIDVEDALELLGPSFEDKSVRSYAVDQLRRASDDVRLFKNTTRVLLSFFKDLQLYLLQLVQALKFEKMDLTDSSNMTSPLLEFLFEKGMKNVILGSYLQW